ncbi:MAG: AAA family ATPase [Candidatus Bathyarchaeia archaeon]
MAAEYLEQLAAKNANEAIQLDRQGSAGMAVAKYQRAVEILLKLCSLYPSSPQSQIYMDRLHCYQRRIQELQRYITYNGPYERANRLGEGGSPGLGKFDQLILNEKPNVRWEDIADLKQCKKAIEDAIVFPVKRPDLFPLGWPRGILFFGPPGCGKTMLAAAVATEIDAAFFCVDAASIMSKWLGESEQNVAALFAEARHISDGGKPAVIFLDEVDSLAGLRSYEVGGEVRVRNQFLKEMDGVLEKSRKSYVYIIGATNKPWALDEPFIRRFQKRIYVPLPDEEGRLELLNLLTKSLKIAPDVDLAYLSKITEGYTASDITDIVQAAHLNVVREFFESHAPNDKSGETRALSLDDFLKVLKDRKPTVSKEMLRNYERWFEAYKGL